MAHFDRREPERIGEIRPAMLAGPGANNAWLTASGRAGHNRAMVWVRWDVGVSDGYVTFHAGMRCPFDDTVVYGELPGVRELAVQVAPSDHAGGLRGPSYTVATQLNLAPGADIGVLLSGLTFRGGGDPPDSIATVWWVSWREAE